MPPLEVAGTSNTSGENAAETTWPSWPCHVRRHPPVASGRRPSAPLSQPISTSRTSSGKTAGQGGSAPSRPCETQRHDHEATDRIVAEPLPDSPAPVARLARTPQHRSTHPGSLAPEARASTPWRQLASFGRARHARGSAPFDRCSRTRRLFYGVPLARQRTHAFPRGDGPNAGCSDACRHHYLLRGGRTCCAVHIILCNLARA